MTNMIEKIARALAERNIPGAVRDKPSWVERQWPHYVADASAALRELLQPTEGMLLAANTAYSFDGCFHEAIHDTLRAAIQAALEGE